MGGKARVPRTDTSKKGGRKPTSPTPEVLLKAKAKADLVEVPARNVLAIEGAGAPEDPAFAAAIGALYGIAYTLKFARKKAGLGDDKVGVLEGEWWSEGDDPYFLAAPRSSWRWRLQIAVPAGVKKAEVRSAIQAATTRKGGKLEASREAERIELVTMAKRRYGRILHIGPYADEPSSIAKLEALLDSENLSREARHLEVYLSDPNRTAPQKLKTALLVPIPA
jgi:hypothetical protein